ncbi:MAG TPA: DUF1775 domain-containing protein [Solirubrobacteraceae bacterium]|nr:DUF1775 domain-containing protein [Solirubrobacteraceae bacterium]
MRIRQIAAAAAGAAALVAPAGAQGHVSLHPNTVPAGAFATLEVRVPGEQEGAYVKKVDMRFPPGFTSVDYANVPGWSARVIEANAEVSRIVWTWVGPLGRVGDGQFVEFPISVAVPSGAAGKALELRTVQTYSDGRVERWIEPSLEAEHPSPRIDVTAKGGVIEDVAGDEAGPAPGRSTGGPAPASTPAATSGGGASKGLAIVALILGALGLAAGLGALFAARRKT